MMGDSSVPKLTRAGVETYARLIPCARLAVAATVLLAAMLGSNVSLAPAEAAHAQAAWWHIATTSRPTYLQPGKDAAIVVDVYNLGDAGISGVKTPVVIGDQLPEGVTATAIAGWAGSNAPRESHDGEVTCKLIPLSCTWEGPAPLQPYEVIEVELTVHVASNAAPGETEVTVAGGQLNACELVAGTGLFKTPACDRKPDGTGESEAHEGSYESREAGPIAPAAIRRTIALSPGETPFGLAEYGLRPELDDGSIDTQAASHPYQLTTTLAFNEGVEAISPPAPARNLHVVLPSGLIGNATIMPQCSSAQFAQYQRDNADLCAADTAVGVAMVSTTFNLGVAASPQPSTSYVVPIFNLTPQEGEPARFGFEVEEIPVVIDTRVRTGSDYAIEATVSNTTTAGVVLSSIVSLWGTPGDSRHDSARGWECVAAHHYNEGPLCPATSARQPAPFLTLPTSCTGELRTSVLAEAWTGASVSSALVQEPLPSLDGCNRIPFNATVADAPDLPQASSASGFSVDVHVPQEASANTDGLAESDVKSTTVTLPAGVAVNPSSAGGLEACTESQVGFLASASSPGDLHFSPTEAACPAGSKVATARITIPVLPHPLEGALYLAMQTANPFGSLIAVYLVAKDPVSGVLVKLAGDASLNPETGQITTTFENTPQAPFEDIELHLFGGERATLSTPARCGAAVTSAQFTPWSGGQAAASQSSFAITSGPHGSACPGVLPFAPTLTAGTSDLQAAMFAPLTTVINREDGEQTLSRVSITMPPGVSGVLTGVKLCGDAEGNAGTCGEESLVGHASATVGVGELPYTIGGGRVYLTGPYRGAPFGLSIVTPAIAGPFNLGNVVIRARVEVDPHTAQLIVTTDESGPYRIPSIIDGIPVQLRRVTVTVDRQRFTFNPSSCKPMGITGNATGGEGAAAGLATSFQVTSCRSLGFTPRISASVTGHGSKAKAVSLTTRLAYPAGSFGRQSNMRLVKVDLPLQLPTQNKTLQQACLAAVFETNPAHCPAGSVVGRAKVATPLLPVPLVGPAYFVSHGGEAFPSLAMVLQGYGIKIVLVGSTLIRHGITSATFKTVPDVPFSKFELTLPQGPFAALTAYLPKRHGYNLCGVKLAMPTLFVAQNGAEIHQSTPITPTGCKKPAHRANQKKRAKR